MHCHCTLSRALPLQASQQALSRLTTLHHLEMMVQPDTSGTRAESASVTADALLFQWYNRQYNHHHHLDSHVGSSVGLPMYDGCSLGNFAVLSQLQRLVLQLPKRQRIKCEGLQVRSVAWQIWEICGRSGRCGIQIRI